jgi:hypothetical protein
MIIPKSNDELKALIKDGAIDCKGDDLFCDFNIDVEASIINARNIKAGDIKARDIKARDIKARDIKARDISYYAFCIVYKNIRCSSIKGTRENSFHKCFDGEVIIKKKKKKVGGDS